MEIFDLKARERKSTGKSQARELRRQGMVPAVLYGPGMQSVPLTVSGHALSDVYKKSASEHVLLNLIISNGDTWTKTAMIKEAQMSPLTHQYLHVDFYAISLDEEIVVKVPVETVGKSKGVERGGMLQMVRYELEVSCLPTNIPAKIVVDVSELDIGDAIHVEEIDPGENVTLLFDNNFTVVTVVTPTVEEEVIEEALEEGAEAEGAEAEGAEAEGTGTDKPVEK